MARYAGLSVILGPDFSTQLPYAAALSDPMLTISDRLTAIYRRLAHEGVPPATEAS